MPEQKINAYDCAACGGTIITVDIDDGVTPFMITCRAKEKCGGNMYSRFYSRTGALLPGWEWYTPTDGEKSKLDPYTLQHVNDGGLLLRQRKR